MTRQIQLTIESDIDNVTLAGMCINKLCSLVPLSELESFQIELSLVEVLTNCIHHAYSDEKGHKIDIHFSLSKEELTLEIMDYGKRLTLLQEPKLDFDPDNIGSIPKGGMGLYLIHSIMDRVEIKNYKGKNIWKLVKNIIKER